MTMQEFCRYSYEKQYQLLKAKGVFLMTRSTINEWVALFTLDTFYVEVVQEQASGKLRLFRSFDSINELDPYLCQININPILNF